MVLEEERGVDAGKTCTSVAGDEAQAAATRDDALRTLREDVARHRAEGASYEDRLFKLLTGSGLVLSSIVQTSSGWRRQRQNRLTASRIAPALQVSRNATRRNLWELMTGRVPLEAQFKGNTATDHGTAMEPVALAWYKANRGYAMEEVRETGLFVDLEKSFIAASPDALVGDDGLLEIKCPLFKIHDCIPPDYLAQVQCQLHVTRRSWCDFLSFTVDKGISLFRVKRSAKYWEWAYPQLEQFYVAVEDDIELPDESVDSFQRAAFAASLCDIERLL